MPDNFCEIWPVRVTAPIAKPPDTSSRFWRTKDGFKQLPPRRTVLPLASPLTSVAFDQFPGHDAPAKMLSTLSFASILKGVLPCRISRPPIQHNRLRFQR